MGMLFLSLSCKIKKEVQQYDRTELQRLIAELRSISTQKTTFDKFSIGRIQFTVDSTGVVRAIVADSVVVERSETVSTEESVQRIEKVDSVRVSDVKVKKETKTQNFSSFIVIVVLFLIIFVLWRAKNLIM